MTQIPFGQAHWTPALSKTKKNNIMLPLLGHPHLQIKPTLKLYLDWIRPTWPMFWSISRFGPIQGWPEPSFTKPLEFSRVPHVVLLGCLLPRASNRSFWWPELSSEYTSSPENPFFSSKRSVFAGNLTRTPRESRFLHSAPTSGSGDGELLQGSMTVSPALSSNLKKKKESKKP